MGLNINRTQFSKSDLSGFAQALNTNLQALAQLLARPGFGRLTGERKIGAELELYLIDPDMRPLHKNAEILEALNDPLYTLELNRYNLEYNLAPTKLDARPFHTTKAQLIRALQQADQHAQTFGGHVLPIGILPTLKQEDFGYHAMTDMPRYHALTHQLKALRGGPFEIDIHGLDTLKTAMEDVTLEGANTSLQIHLQVEPEAFADTYNALQLATPLVLAFAANSPFVFGQRLWHETRIPLFKQSIDCRPYDPLRPSPARVNYGHGWVRQGAWELFDEAVRLYQPLLPICAEQDAMQSIKAGDVPSLEELRLQQGTVWLWNRPVFDDAEGGHLRIEARALPAGPSVDDMVANMVLLLGLTEYLRPRIAELISAIPFEYCARNFYRAAQFGFDAELMWPFEDQNQPQYRSCRSLLEHYLPKVSPALQSMSVDAQDIAPFIRILERRLNNGQTGAAWQLSCFERLFKNHRRDEALSLLVKAYRENVASGEAVSQWARL